MTHVTSVRNLVPIRDGQGVTMTLHLVRYGSSTSGTAKPATWSETIPQVAQGNYLWTWTHIEYSDGTKSDAYSVSRIGIDGKGVKSSSVDYSMQESSVNPENINNWGAYPANLVDGYWLYTRTVLVYSDNQSTTSYSVSQIGVGSYYAGCQEYYCAGPSPMEPPFEAPAAGTYANGDDLTIDDNWQQMQPALNAINCWLWNFEVSADSRGNRYVTLPIVIGNFSKSITSIVETYCISKFSKPDKAGAKFPSDCTKWTDEQQDAAPTDEKPYQWNRTVVNYNDGAETFYHVSAVRGPKGKDAHSPKVGDNNNWWFWDDDQQKYVDSGTSAEGDDGHSPYIGGNGNWWQWDPAQNKYVDSGTQAQGAGGSTPHIGTNGNWFIDEMDTGVSAQGAAGATPYIGQNGNWWVGTQDSGVKAQGTPGNTPVIGDNGNWWIDGKDTGRNAIGDDGHSPYINKTTKTWWEYNATTRKYEDTGIKAEGENGETPYIGADGFWYIGSTKTTVKAEGTPGSSPYIGTNGNWFVGTTDTGVKAEGTNGHTPSIGSNGNWFINGVDTGLTSKGDNGRSPYINTQTNTWMEYDANQGKYVDTGIQAKGINGETPWIGADGFWWIGNIKTNIRAEGQPGDPGAPGLTPYIGDNKHWWIGTTDTGIKAEGDNGYTPSIGANGNWWINGVDTGRSSKGDNGHSPYIDDETGTWWEYNSDTGQYEDTGIVPKGDRGNDGADGVQPNLFGYDTKIMCLNGNHVAIHTPDGFVTELHGDDDANGIRRCLVRLFNIITKPGIYSVSGYAHTIFAATKMEVDACDVQVLLGGENTFIVNTTKRRFAFKFSVPSVDNIYNFVDFEFSDYGGNPNDVVVIENLKIEAADNLRGISTPFAGLALDKIFNNENLLLNTRLFDNPAKWDALRGSVQEGMQGCKAYYRSNGTAVEVDMLQQSIVLKPNTTYTLSYYAKCSGSCWSFVYPDVSGWKSHSDMNISYSQMTPDYPWSQNGNTWTSGNKDEDGTASVLKVVVTNNGNEDGAVDIVVRGGSEANYDMMYVSDSFYGNVSDVKSAAESSFLLRTSGSGVNRTVNVAVPAKSTKTLYVGYAKDGSVSNSDDEYSVEVSIVDSLWVGCRVVDGVGTYGGGDNYHVIEPSSDWKLHTITFRTSHDLSGTKHVLWRVMPNSWLYVAMPKLEEGEKHTPWQANEEDRRGNDGKSFNIVEWEDVVAQAPYQFYSQKQITSDTVVADIVHYNNYYYLCKVGYVYYSGDAAPSADDTHWQLFQNFGNIATGIVLSEAMNTNILQALYAKIDELIVQRLQTALSGPRCVIEGSQFEIWGSGGQPSIKAAVRADGVAVLEFYNADGDKMYDLGPESITAQVTAEQSKMSAIGSYGAFNTGLASTRANLTTILNLTTSQYYRFSEGWKMVGSVKQYYQNQQYDGKVYDSNSVNGGGESCVPTGNLIPYGTYFGPEFMVPSISGQQPIYSRTCYRVWTNGDRPESTSKALFYRKSANNTMTPVTKSGTNKSYGSSITIWDLMESSLLV